MNRKDRHYNGRRYTPAMPDPFTTLGLPPRYGLDPDELERRVLTLSSELHPDRFIDPLEQADAAERIAAVNHAHRTLLDPATRALALLASQGHATGDDKALPPDLLMEVMEVREALEEATVAGDQAELERLRRWAEDQRDERLAKVAELFDVTPVDGAAVRVQLNALRYATRMLEQMPDGDY